MKKKGLNVAKALKTKRSSKSKTQTKKGKKLSKVKVTSKAQATSKAKKQARPTKKSSKTGAQKKVKSVSKVQSKSRAKPAVSKKSDFKKTSVLPFVFSPLDDRILVRLLPVETVTPGGIIIPEMVTADSQGYYKAEVVAVGPGHKDKKGRVRPLEVTKGDKVLFQRYAGERIDIGGAIHFILRESEVLGVTP
jgi:chaperonin GroES